LTDRDDADAFGKVVAAEMLESQALRTHLVGIIFASASLFIIFVAIYFYVRYGWIAALTPATVFLVSVGITVFEFGMRRVIRRHIRRGDLVPTGAWYATACVEITAMSAILVFIHSSMSNAIFTLSSPPFAGYFLFIVLSTLYLNGRLSLFTGALAAIQYLLIVVFIFSQVGSNAAEDALFLTPGIYLAKTAILIMAGFGAAFVARELSRRQMTSLKALDERNREHHANTMKSQFLADMSHEIRTPLNAVIGYAQLLEIDHGITPSQRKAVEAIRVGGRHLLAVVNDVLDISKIEAGGETVTPSRFNLTAMLQELTLIFPARCAEKRIAWIFEMGIDASDVTGDEGKLRQVLTNILGNAVKFTEIGHVALRVTRDVDEQFRFEVEDTGPGIPEDRHEDIFDPFAQEIQGRLSGGTGLGLAIAQRYVRLMGGEITVESTPGMGARFRFSISLSGSSTETTAVDPLPQTFRLAPGQVVHALVTDDIAVNRNVLRKMLEQAGVTVDTADDGIHTLELIENPLIDIAFLDIRMPEMSGEETVSRIREIGRDDVKFVAVSASALTHEQTTYLAAGFDGFLDKPVQMANLYELIETLLGVSFVKPAVELSDHGARLTQSRVILPEDLQRSLVDAARRHNITDLKRSISDVETLGDVERIFAIKLRELCGTYDMNAILVALNESGHD
jgi:signal transduction histidine kinase/CheY-like chemotaxis protein